MSQTSSSFHEHSRLARLQRAFAAMLVAGSALLPSGASPGSAESRVHDQVNQLLRVINRLGRLKAGERELRDAEQIRRAQVHAHGRQPSEWQRRGDPFSGAFAPVPARRREMSRVRPTNHDGVTA